MKSLLVKLCIVSCLFLWTYCNNSSKKETTGSADSTTATADTATTQAAPANKMLTTKTVPPNEVDYSFEPAVSVITGTITKETFYGSPGFGENPETDEKEERLLLLLEKPINVIGPEDADDAAHETKNNVTKIQLLYDKDAIDMARNLGSTVRLTGTFFGAHTGHHHTDVLMDVTKVEHVLNLD